MNFLAVSMTGVYQCGNLGFDIPGQFPYLVHLIVLAIKIVVPILLIIFGMLDLGKAVVASKEDEIKKGQQTFIKRLIAAVIVFFVVQIVQVVITFVASGNSDDKSNITQCFACFVNGSVLEGNNEIGCEEISK